MVTVFRLQVLKKYRTDGMCPCGIAVSLLLSYTRSRIDIVAKGEKECDLLVQ